MIEKSKDVYEMKTKGAGFPIFLVERKNAFYITASEKVKNDLIKGKGGMDIAKLRNNIGTVYINFKKITPHIPPIHFLKGVIKALKPLDDVTFTTNAVRNATMITNGSVRFNDKSQNAILILMDLAQKHSESNKKADEPISMR